MAGVSQGIRKLLLLYDAEGSPIGFLMNGSPYTYVKNIQGDIIKILDMQGNAVVSYTYDPWGVPTATGNTTIAEINPCTYRGYDYDEDTGYFYLQSRYYSPSSGRFLNADDYRILGIAGTLSNCNLFVYCGNNPVMYADPSGYVASRAVVAAVSAAIFGGIAYAIGKAIGLKGGKLAALTAGFTTIGLVLGLWKGVAILYKINKMIKPLIYFFKNPGKVYFGLKLLKVIQFEVHAPHHNKPIHFVVRLFLKTGQKVWEWYLKK